MTGKIDYWIAYVETQLEETGVFLFPKQSPSALIMYEALRAKHPNAHLTYVTTKEGREILGSEDHLGRRQRPHYPFPVLKAQLT